MGYTIGSFNTCNFGYGANKNPDVFADIIYKEQLDIIALQEILRQEALDSILRRLPRGWTGAFKPPRSRSASAAKGFAFIWNTKRVKECSKDGPQIFEQIKYGSLVRNPYYGRFTPSGCGGPFSEIRLINIHLCSPAESKESRSKEFALVAGEIHTRISKQRYGDFRPAYTVVLGDYNMSQIWCEQATSEDQLVMTYQRELTTLKQEEGFANDYDHFSYDYNRFSGIGIQVERINSVQKYCGNDFSKHRESVSDHVPIKISINF